MFKRIVILMISLYLSATPLAFSSTLKTTPSKASLKEEKENFRISPNGKKIGVLFKDTQMDVLERRGRWVRIRVEGWMYAPSLSIKQTSQPSKKSELSTNKRNENPIKIESWKWINDESLNRIRIEGVIRNISTKTLRSVRLYAVIKDGNGVFLGTDVVTPSPMHLKPNDFAIFKATIQDAQCKTEDLILGGKFSVEFKEKKPLKQIEPSLQRYRIKKPLSSKGFN